MLSRRFTSLSLSLVATLVALTLAAAPAALAEDTVLLTNGGRLRGVVMEESPERVSVQLRDGTVRTLEANEVKRVIVDGEGSTENGVLVELIADNPNAVLQRVNAEFAAQGTYTSIAGQDTSTVCQAPCNKALDSNVSYRVAGEGVTPSAPFLLPRASDGARVAVKAGDPNAKALGLLTGTAGVCVGVLGGAFLLAGATGGDDGFVGMGALALGAGTLVAVPGYVVMAMNETSVDVTDRTSNE